MLGLLTLVLIGVALLLWVGALRDFLRTPAEQVRFVPKLVWLLFLIHAPLFGALVWSYLGKKPARIATRGPIHRIEPLVNSGSGGI